MTDRSYRQLTSDNKKTGVASTKYQTEISIQSTKSTADGSHTRTTIDTIFNHAHDAQTTNIITDNRYR